MVSSTSNPNTGSKPVVALATSALALFLAVGVTPFFNESTPVIPRVDIVIEDTVGTRGQKNSSSDPTTAASMPEFMEYQEADQNADGKLCVKVCPSGPAKC